MQTIIKTTYAERHFQSIPRATANVIDDENCGHEGNSIASWFIREGERADNKFGEVFEYYKHLVTHEFLVFDGCVGQTWMFIFNDGSSVQYCSFEEDPVFAWTSWDIRYTDIKEL